MKWCKHPDDDVLRSIIEYWTSFHRHTYVKYTKHKCHNIMRCLQIIYFMDTVDGLFSGRAAEFEDESGPENGKVTLPTFIFLSSSPFFVLPQAHTKSSLNYWIHAHITKLSYKEGMTRKTQTHWRKSHQFYVTNKACFSEQLWWEIMKLPGTVNSRNHKQFDVWGAHKHICCRTACRITTHTSEISIYFCGRLCMEWFIQWRRRSAFCSKRGENISTFW